MSREREREKREGRGGRGGSSQIMLVDYPHLACADRSRFTFSSLSSSSPPSSTSTSIPQPRSLASPLSVTGSVVEVAAGPFFTRANQSRGPVACGRDAQAAEKVLLTAFRGKRSTPSLLNLPRRFGPASLSHREKVRRRSIAGSRDRASRSTPGLVLLCCR